MTARVLHVVATGKRRGAEQFASDLVEALAGAGVEQRVAVLRSGGGTAVRYAAPLTTLGPEGWRLPGLRVDPRIAAALRRLVERWRPQIIQAHGGEALKYAELARPARTGARVVYRRIGGAPTWITRGPRRAAYRLLMRRAARVVAVAEAVRLEVIRTFRLPPSHVVTIPNAVDARRLRPTRGREAIRRSLGIPASAPVLLSLGALTWEKDPLAHVDVAAKVLGEVREAIHLVVGDGPIRADVDDRIRQLGLDGRVRTLGSRTDVADLLAASDVVLFASRPDGMEGMPAVVIEAGMAGVPVVGFSVSGLPEVVVEGTTGMLVPWGDRQGLARRVVEVLTDEEARRAMGRAARERCRANFDIVAVAPRYVRLYEELSSVR